MSNLPETHYVISSIDFAETACQLWNHAGRVSVSTYVHRTTVAIVRDQPMSESTALIFESQATNTNIFLPRTTPGKLAALQSALDAIFEGSE